MSISHRFLGHGGFWFYLHFSCLEGFFVCFLMLVFLFLGICVRDVDVVVWWDFVEGWRWSLLVWLFFRCWV